MKATHKDWILFNGRMINTKEEQPMVALEERGFQFGDGIYEVFRLYDGKPHLLDLHLERFFNSMAGNKTNSTIYEGRISRRVISND